MVGQLSSCYSPHHTHSRPSSHQDFMKVKTTSFVAPNDSADKVSRYSECWLSSDSLLLLYRVCFISKQHIQISPSTCELLISVPTLHTDAVSSHAILVCLADYSFLSCAVYILYPYLYKTLWVLQDLLTGLGYECDRNSVQSWGGVDRGIELMPKSCPTEPVAGRPRDKEKQRERTVRNWEMEKRGGKGS